MKKETMTALEEYNVYLTKMLAGDVTLVDSIGIAQLAIQAAISQAFQTPDIISMFAKKQPLQLRTRLAQIERDFKISSMQEEEYKRLKSEILVALQKLGDDLLEEEKVFLHNNATDSLKEFTRASETNRKFIFQPFLDHSLTLFFVFFTVSESQVSSIISKR